jgi:hypothetical protein
VYAEIYLKDWQKPHDYRLIEDREQFFNLRVSMMPGCSQASDHFCSRRCRRQQARRWLLLRMRSMCLALVMPLAAA